VKAAIFSLVPLPKGDSEIKFRMTDCYDEICWSSILSKKPMRFFRELLLFNKNLTITEYRSGKVLFIQNERNNYIKVLVVRSILFLSIFGIGIYFLQILMSFFGIFLVVGFGIIHYNIKRKILRHIKFTPKQIEVQYAHWWEKPIIFEVNQPALDLFINLKPNKAKIKIGENQTLIATFPLHQLESLPKLTEGIETIYNARLQENYTLSNSVECLRFAAPNRQVRRNITFGFATKIGNNQFSITSTENFALFNNQTQRIKYKNYQIIEFKNLKKIRLGIRVYKHKDGIYLKLKINAIQQSAKTIFLVDMKFKNMYYPDFLELQFVERINRLKNELNLLKGLQDVEIGIEEMKWWEL
jgi:hypothetical protein